jgi:S-DNA-T family DNA segregation ATPase FtsK/SpoIIIE
VAQRGRSLGLHLILATQRPAGVIRDNLRANTNLRVALRVADEDDSTDVLGSPIAAGFDPAIPGRGAAKTGPNRIRAFQSGYAGGWTTDDGEAAAVDIEELRFGSGPIWEQPVDPEAEQRKAAVAAGPSDIKRVVATVQKAARMSEIPAPRKPWLPELAPTYDFTKLTTKRTDTELVLGVLDDAATQSQPVVSYLPDRDGNMAIIGTGGAGKSSALREVAVAAAVTVRGGPVQVYGLDFAGGALQMLEVLPHVGAIIPGDDEDRMARLLRWLSDLVAERAVRYNEARASTIVEYRKLASMHDEPRILLLLDGMGAFREAYESSITMPWFSMLSQIAIDGRQVGVHLVITGDRAASIPASLSSSIQRRLVLRLANADDYSTLGVPADVLTPSSPPGRGIIDGQEMQVAVIGGDPNVALQARELGTLAAAMAKAGVADAPVIESLPESVALSALPVAQGDRPVLGIADDTLAPVGADLEGAFVIAGPPGSGKTTALVTVASALARVTPGTERHLLSPRRSAIAALPVWTSTSSGDDQIAKRITALMKRVSAPADGAPTAIFVESIADFEDSDLERELEDLMRAATRNGHLFAAEADTALWNQSPTFGRPMRTARRGIILQPEEGDDDLLRASFGRIRRGSLPPGRGFLVAGTKSRKLQVAMPDGLAYGDG